MELHMKQLIKLCVVTGLSLFLSTGLQAGTYKWTDEQGNVHYGQRPPPGKQYEKVKIEKPPRSSGTTQAPASNTATESDKASKTVEAEVARNAEIRKQNCKAAKNNLQLYQVKRYIKGEDGKTRRVDKEERESKIKQQKGYIREFCD